GPHEAARVQALQHGQRIVGGGAGHESPHQRAGGRHALHEAPDGGPSREREENGAYHRNRSIVSAMIPSRSPQSLTTTASVWVTSRLASTMATPGTMRSARPGSRHGEAARSLSVNAHNRSRNAAMAARLSRWPCTRAAS